MEQKIKVGDLVGTNHNNVSGIVTEIREGKIERIILFGKRYFTVESLAVKKY